MPTAVNPQIIRKIEKMHSKGFLLVAIAAEVRLSRNTVARYVKAARERKINREGKVVPPLKVDEIRRLRFLAHGIVGQRTCARCTMTLHVWRGQAVGYCSWCGQPWR